MAQLTEIYHSLIRVLATAFGAGYAPVAPGTFGSIVGCIFVYLVHKRIVPFDMREATLAITIVAIVVAHLAESSFGKKDAQQIVIDEVAGMMLTMCFVNFTAYHLVIGFLLFRLFDVAKIFPCGWAQDNLPGGIGVVGDDLFAGVQAGLTMLALPTLVKTVAEWIR